MKKYIIKGDLSGIQNFIFDVKSDGAAKELKKRSIYITELTKKLLNEDKERFNNNFNVIYDGGGNYFVEFDSDEDVEKINDYFQVKSTNYIQDDILPFFAVAPYENSFSQAMQDVNIEMLKVKQRRKIPLTPYQYQEKKVDEIKKGNGINYHFPKNSEGMPLDFDKMAERGFGDDKLAALKIDVDHLGMVFRNREKEEYKALSSSLTRFFDEDLLRLIKSNDYSDQVYVVFSGGDDCFLIGCWHTMIHLAVKIRDAFSELNDNLKSQVSSLESEITLSAGLTIFPPKYPIKQIAEEAESFLNKAKREGRNKITLFGYALSWDDYRSVLELNKQLFDLVKKGESKSLIHRVRSSELGYLSIQNRIKNRGLLDLPKVWKLKYYLRNVKKDNLPEVEKLFDDYSESLIDDFMAKEVKTNPIKYPIAARLTELLLKNKNYE